MTWSCMIHTCLHLGEASRKSLQKLALANVRSVGYNKEHRISISFLSSFHSHEEKQGQDCKMDWIPHGESGKKSSCLMRRFRMGIDTCTYNIPKLLLFMEEILHQLISSLSHLFTRFYTSQLVQDFFNQYWMDDHLVLELFEITQGGRCTSSHFTCHWLPESLSPISTNPQRLSKNLVIFHHKNDNSQLLTIRISGSEILHQRFQST